MRRLWSLAALLAAAAFPVLADERMEHAEWVSEFREGTGEASTEEGGISRFGILCTDDNCRFYFENGINCEPGNNYPVVIATSAGSIAVESICAPAVTATGEVMRYWFTELPQLNEALMQSDTVGVAFPLSSGQFKISQFLMNGYGEATERIASGLRARRAEREARESADRERRAREAAERARRAQEAVERARQVAAEQALERARKATEREAAERARVAAEQEAASRAAATAAVPVPDASESRVRAEEPAQGAATVLPEGAAKAAGATGEGLLEQPADTEDAAKPQGTERPRSMRLPSRL